MLTFEEFKELLEEKFKFDNIIEDANNLLGISYESNIVQIPWIWFDKLIFSYFTQEGADILFELLYDNEKDDIEYIWNEIKPYLCI